MRQEMLHRAEQVEAKPPALRVGGMDGPTREHFSKKRMAHVPRRIRIPQHTFQIGDHWLIIRIAKVRQRPPTILGVRFRQTDASPSCGEEGS
jgi:hypothetical protein